MRSRPLVLAVGHVPPPVHGMAVATERLVALIAERAEVRLLVISVEKRSGLRRHLTRVGRTTGAIARMAVHRARSRTLYVGSDAGLGMAYTLAVVGAGRILRYRIFLHHHSAAYVNETSTLMSAVVRAGGRRSTHVLSCAGQARAFDDRYRTATPSMVVPICFALGPESEEAPAPPGRHGARLTLGHMSNLCAEKGLERVFETLEAAVAAGMDAHLLLAGPAATARDEALLRRLLARAGPRVTYLGPAGTEGKRRFFGEIDVFLFPSRYRHESFGLVAAEAMQAGVPVIAYRAGCLDAAFVADAGVVLEPSEDFPALAVAQLRRWADDVEALQACAESARHRARSARREAVVGAAAFVQLLTGPSRSR